MWVFSWKSIYSASEMTYILSSGALNSTNSTQMHAMIRTLTSHSKSY